MRIALACLAAPLLAAATGCSTTSTITRVDAPTMEAHIVGGDAEYVYVGPKEAAEAIPRADIKDIDYPGDLAMAAGAIAAAGGAVELAAMWSTCDRRSQTGACFSAAAPIAAGVPLFFWGLATHASAMNAARAAPHAQGVHLGVAPVVAAEAGQRGETAGAVVVGVF